MSYDANGGTQIIKGKTGTLELKVGTGAWKKAYIQDWALQNQFDNKDVTPMGYEGEWKIPDNVKSSGSSKFIFRSDSEVNAIFVGLFADVITKETEGGSPTAVLVADPTIQIRLKLKKTPRIWYEVDITVESINDNLSVGNTNSFDVSWSVKGKPQYVKLTGAVAALSGPATVGVGSDITLTPSVDGAAAGYTLVWTSATPATATVVNGVVHGVAAGTSVITVDVKEGATTVATATKEITVA